MAKKDLGSITLRVTSRGKEPVDYIFSEGFVIGRTVKENGADLQLDDDFVSIKHSTVTPRATGDGWYLDDLGSTNGTWLNNKKEWGSTRLRKGDRIRVGKTTLEVLSVMEKLEIRALAREARPRPRLTPAQRAQIEEMFPGAIPLEWHEPSPLDLETARERHIYMMGYCDGWREHEIESQSREDGTRNNTQPDRAHCEPVSGMEGENHSEMANTG